METSQHLFKELEIAEKLFTDGSIKNAQKKIRNVINASKSLKVIPNKLRHKINAAVSKSRYFDDMSSFAVNPKREQLISEIENLVKNPLENPKKHAHNIHEIQTRWQLLDLSSKPASKFQWQKFNDLSNKAWESCKEYFDEIKGIKIDNATEREKIINQIYKYTQEHQKKWPDLIQLVKYLKSMFIKWQKYAPVLEKDLDRLKNQYFEARKPINDEIKKQEKSNKEKKDLLIKKVIDISDDDNEKCILAFKKLKDEWFKIGPAGKKEDKVLWDQFNKNGDKFFVDRKEKLLGDIKIIKDLNTELIEGSKSISDITNELTNLENIKQTSEYKKIIKDINDQKNKTIKDKKVKKIKQYKNIYDVLIEKSDIENAPVKFHDSIQKSKSNSSSSLQDLEYICIKLEILAGIESPKKDLDKRNNIQLELLSNKFNKQKNSNNDLDSCLQFFISNFSKNKTSSDHTILWKRISKCIDLLN